jgi:hypothetical protein
MVVLFGKTLILRSFRTYFDAYYVGFGVNVRDGFNRIGGAVRLQMMMKRGFACLVPSRRSSSSNELTLHAREPFPSG